MRERLVTAKIIIAGLVVGIIFLLWMMLIDHTHQRRAAFRAGAIASARCTANMDISIFQNVPEERAKIAWMYCMEEKARVLGYEWR